ncbi:hypothetical protein ONS96_014884 [Cadophora gregata f. sp. sojae]|nr:hypothetical protein ONS96_014884 [Cadophora gregata f. sp. sojae]
MECSLPLRSLSHDPSAMQTRKRPRPRRATERQRWERWLHGKTTRRIELFARELGGCLAPLIDSSFQAHERMARHRKAPIIIIVIWLNSWNFVFMESVLYQYLMSCLALWGLDGWAEVFGSWRERWVLLRSSLIIVRLLLSFKLDWLQDWSLVLGA